MNATLKSKIVGEREGKVKSSPSSFNQNKVVSTSEGAPKERRSNERPPGIRKETLDHASFLFFKRNNNKVQNFEKYEYSNFYFFFLFLKF